MLWQNEHREHHGLKATHVGPTDTSALVPSHTDMNCSLHGDQSAKLVEAAPGAGNHVQAVRLFSSLHNNLRNRGNAANLSSISRGCLGQGPVYNTSLVLSLFPCQLTPNWFCSLVKLIFVNQSIRIFHFFTIGEICCFRRVLGFGINLLRLKV